MSDKLDMIYDLLKNDRKEAGEFRKEVRDSHKKTDDRLTKLEIQGEAQNISLDKHIEGVKTLKQLHLDNVSRIKTIENDVVVLREPAKVMSVLKKWLLGAATVATAIITISKLMGLF